MTTANALDPPPVRRRAVRAHVPRIAAVVAGVVIAALVIFAIVHIVFGHAGTQAESARANFGGGAASSQQVQPPPAVTPQQAAQAQANLAALERAANAPGLAVRPVQISTVSPPAGRVPSGVGVTSQSASVGPSNG